MGMSSTKWHGVSLRYLVSYTVLFTLPIFLMYFMLYRDFSGALRAEIVDNNMQMLRRIQTEIDKEMTDIQKLCFQIETSPKTTTAIVTRDAYAGYELVGVLRDYVYINDFIRNVVVYVKDSDILYSASGSYNRATFNQTICVYQNWPKEQMFAELDQLGAVAMRVSDSVTLSGSNSSEAIMTYMYPMPRASRDPSAVILVMLKKAAIERAIGREFRGYRADTFVFDEAGALITSLRQDGRFGYDELEPLLNQTASGYASAKLGGERYIMEYTTSDANSWRYVSVIPEEDIFKGALGLFARVGYFIALVVLLGIALVTVFMRVNYLPLRRLKQMVERNMKLSINGWGGVDVLYSALNNLFEGGAVGGAHTEQQRRVLRQNLFLNALKGQITDVDQFQFAAGELDMAIDEKQFMVALFQTPADRGMQLAAQLDDITRNAPSDATILPLDTVDAGTVLVIFVMDEPERSAQLIEAMIRQIKAHMDSALAVSAGNAYTDVTQIGKSYVEAMAALQYGTMPEAGVLWFSQLDASVYGREWHDTRELNNLSMELWQGNYEGVQHVLAHIFTGAERLPLFLLRLLCFEVMNHTLRTLHEMKVDLKSTGLDYHELSRLTETDTADRFIEAISDLLIVVCGHVKQLKESGNGDLRSRMTAYIEHNYSDPNLLLETMAESLGVSYSYMSRYFKDQTGMNLSEYLSLVRKEKFKELAVSEGKDASELAARVGYLNLSSFSRMFKKTEGITPKQYIDLHRNKGDNEREE